MPIKGRSDVVRIPRVGKIRLGLKQTRSGGTEYPTATDYFVVAADDATSATAAKAFHHVYGPQPKEITIAFASDDPEEFFPQYLSSYRGGAGRYELFCRGDGVSAHRADEKGGYAPIACSYKECAFYVAKKCKELGKLQFFLPDVPGIGVWQIDTTSFHSTVNLNSAITLVQAVTGGRIKMIPLTLRIQPKRVSPEGKPKTVYVLDLKLEDVRLKDFMETVPLLSSFAPMVEHIALDEMPDDLYVEQDLVRPTGAPAPTGVTPLFPDDVAYFEKRLIKTLPDGEVMALVCLRTQDGAVKEGVTTDPTLLKILKTLKKEDIVRHEFKDTHRVPGRLELVHIEPVWQTA